MDLKRFFTRKKEEDGQALPGDLTKVGTGVSWLKKSQRFGPPLQTSGPYVLVTMIAMMMADLTALSLRSSMIPHSAPPAKRQIFEQPSFKSITDYNDILSRNIFNSDGVIPDLQIADNQAPDTSGPAKESQLPITLVGTIVHANAGKSVATLELKGNAEKILPYIPNDDIEGLATLIKVERKKVFIRNLSTGTLEYVEIKDDNAFSFQRKQVAQTQDGPVTKEAEDTFAITRSDLETQMNNLPELLTQARAVPNMVGGRVDGFKIVDIQDNSIFKKLGITQNDIIKSVDGEELDSPAKAMELYNALRNKTSVQISVERNGKTENMTYNIR